MMMLANLESTPFNTPPADGCRLAGASFGDAAADAADVGNRALLALAAELEDGAAVGGRGGPYFDSNSFARFTEGGSWKSLPVTTGLTGLKVVTAPVGRDDGALVGTFLVGSALDVGAEDMKYIPNSATLSR
eukprot:scpid67844/ scgid34836/ 